MAVVARVLRALWQLLLRSQRAAGEQLETSLGGPLRRRVVVALACVLALSSADAATVGASAVHLRDSLDVGNTEIGLLVTVTGLVGAVATIPFGVLVDRVRRTWLLGGAIVLWGVAMLWSATVGSFSELLVARCALGAVTAVAGPAVASLVGDWFSGAERGRIYGYVLSGELLGAGLGFVVTGDIAALSWRAAFVVLSVPAFVLAVLVLRLPEPQRGGRSPLVPVGQVPAPVPTDAEGQPPPETDAQRLARERGLVPDATHMLVDDPSRLSLLQVVRHVLGVRTNVVLIASSACGYFFLAGVQTFGIEFVKGQYGVNQVVANLALLAVGVGAVGGVLAGGALSDALLRRGRLNARLAVSAASAVLAALLFLPALLMGSLLGALPYLAAASFALSAQNPPLDAARLDVMPSPLWGRAEAVRTVLRALAQALAPLIFGFSGDHVFGGGRVGLQRTFLVMLLPLLAAGVVLFRGLRHYPGDVATAAAWQAAHVPDSPRAPRSGSALSPVLRRSGRSGR